MLWQVFVLSILIWIAYIFYIGRHKRKLANSLKKHSLPKYPFIGIARLFIGSDEDVMNGIMTTGKEAIRLGGILCDLMLINHFVLVVADADDAEVILRTALQKTPISETVSSDIIGNGHVYAKVPIWRPRRKIMTPTFSQKNLNHFETIFSRRSQLMTEKLKAVAGKGSFSMWKYIYSYSMDSICETTMGANINAQNDSGHPFMKAIENGGKILAFRMLKPWLHPNFIFKMSPHYKPFIEYVKFMKLFVEQLIREKRLEYKQKQQTKDDAVQNEPEKLKSFLELLIENSNYTDVELREEILVLVIAGTDTSGVGSLFTSVLLSQYQEVQEKVYQELKEVFGNSDRPVLPEDLVRLKYLEAVVKESLRLYPPGPIIGRLIENELTIPSGCKLVEGTNVIVNIWAIHRNPKYWGDDAEEFRPERFYNTTLEHPNAFLPFSNGPRNCIGRKYAMMSIMTLIANLVRQYKLLPAKNIPLYDPQNPKKRLPLRTKYDVMMKHIDNYQLEIERRF